MRASAVIYSARVERTLLSLIRPHLQIHGSRGETLNNGDRVRASVLFGSVDRIVSPVAPIDEVSMYSYSEWVVSDGERLTILSVQIRSLNLVVVSVSLQIN
jgi:hypothetical protein